MAVDPHKITDNYIRLDRWSRAKFGRVTPLVDGLKANLKRLDSVCVRCKDRGPDHMACKGVRQFFDEEQSEYRGRAFVTLTSCYKRLARSEDAQIERRMVKAGIPLSVLQEIADNRTDRTDAKVEQAGGTFIIGGTELPPLCRDTYSEDFQRIVFEYMFNLAEVGFSPKYFFMGDFARRVQQAGGSYRQEDRVADILDPDWLVVDRPDYWAGMEYVRDMFFEVLRERVAKRLPTMFVVGKGALTIRNEQERQLFEVSEKWPPFPLK